MEQSVSAQRDVYKVISARVGYSATIYISYRNTDSAPDVDNMAGSVDNEYNDEGVSPHVYEICTRCRKLVRIGSRHKCK